MIEQSPQHIPPVRAAAGRGTGGCGVNGGRGVHGCARGGVGGGRGGAGEGRGGGCPLPVKKSNK